VDIQKGQRVKLSDLSVNSQSFKVEVSISGITVDTRLSHKKLT